MKGTRPPGPRGLTKWRLLLGARRDPIAFLTDLRTRYGDVTSFRLGPARFVVLANSELAFDLFQRRADLYVKGAAELRTAARLMGRGLLASEGAHHARERAILEPIMSPDAVERFAGAVAVSTERLISRWQPEAPMDVEPEMNRLAEAVVVRALFGVDVDDDTHPLPAALREVTEAYGRLPVPFSSVVARLPLPANRRFGRARTRLDAIIHDLIEARRREPTDDLLSDLVRAGLGNDDIRDEAVTLFLPGRKPLATALTWAWYLLSANPEAEARLQSEVDTLFGSRARLGLEDLAGLQYARAVLSEALRLYPPAWIVLRKAVREHDIDGYRIRAGTSVVASHYVIHHDPRYHPEPEVFDPDRWIDGRTSAGTPFSWFPFGGGDRRCIGEGLARMEGVLVLAIVARAWHLKHMPGHRVERWPKVTLLPRHGMMMIPERRGVGAVRVS